MEFPQNNGIDVDVSGSNSSWGISTGLILVVMKHITCSMLDGVMLTSMNFPISQAVLSANLHTVISPGSLREPNALICLKYG